MVLLLREGGIDVVEDGGLLPEALVLPLGEGATWGKLHRRE